MNVFCFKVYDLRSATEQFFLIRGKYMYGHLRKDALVQLITPVGPVSLDASDGLYEGTMQLASTKNAIDCIVLSCKGEIPIGYSTILKDAWVVNVDESQSNPSMVITSVDESDNGKLALSGILSSGKICVNDDVGIISSCGKVKLVKIKSIKNRYLDKSVGSAQKWDDVLIELYSSYFSLKDMVQAGSLLCSKDVYSVSSKRKIYLESAGAAKLGVVKALLEHFALGVSLPEAKKLVDQAPVLLPFDLTQFEMAKLKVDLEEAGAIVSLR